MRQISLNLWVTSSVLALLLGGCVSTYHRPSVVIPEHYKHASPLVSNAGVDSQWWQSFGDANLDRVVKRALASNLDLAAATLTVRRAQLAAGITSRDQWPQASGEVTASHSNATTSYAASASLSYDLDLWRRLSSATSAARWEAQATQEDRDATQLALIGTVCQLYWDIAFTHQQIKAGEATLAYQRKILDLVAYQHSVGATSGIEVAESQQVVNAQLAALSNLAQHLVEDRAAMAILLGNHPLAVDDELHGLPDRRLADIPAGLPSDLLARRPDVRASEMRLRATLATGDAVKASLYPDLILTGNGGSASTELSSLLSHPTASIAALITLPFLDFKRHKLNEKLTQVDYEIAVQRFRQTLYTALADTDNTLSNQTELAHEREALQNLLEAASTAERLYGIRYQHGAVALRVWLDAQQSQRAAQLAYDRNRLLQLNNLVIIYQALGGGAGPVPPE